MTVTSTLNIYDRNILDFPTPRTATNKWWLFKPPSLCANETSSLAEWIEEPEKILEEIMVENFQIMNHDEDKYKEIYEQTHCSYTVET